MSVIVIGSVNVDIVTYADRAPRPGESLTGHRYSMVLGGKGSNQSVAVARLGMPVRFIGRVGADSFGDFIRSRLVDLGVDPDHLTIDTALPTGIAVIGVDGRGENAITVIPGANTGLAVVEQVESAAPLFREAKVLLAQLEHPFPATLKAVELARRAGALAILDPAPIPTFPFLADTIRLFDALTPNEIETEALTGIVPVDIESAAAAARWLREAGLPLALIKNGRSWRLRRQRRLSGPRTAVCGEGHRHGGGRRLLCSRSRRGARRGHDGGGAPFARAAAAGALACTKEGSSEAAPTRQEVEALLTKNNRAP